MRGWQDRDTGSIFSLCHGAREYQPRGEHDCWEVLFVERYCQSCISSASRGLRKAQTTTKRKRDSFFSLSAVSHLEDARIDHMVIHCVTGMDLCTSMTSTRARHSPTPDSENIPCGTATGEFSGLSRFDDWYSSKCSVSRLLPYNTAAPKK